MVELLRGLEGHLNRSNVRTEREGERERERESTRQLGMSAGLHIINHGMASSLDLKLGPFSSTLLLPVFLHGKKKSSSLITRPVSSSKNSLSSSRARGKEKFCIPTHGPRKSPCLTSVKAAPLSVPNRPSVRTRCKIGSKLLFHPA